MKPMLQWKINKDYIFCVCVCSLSYPACNAHAPYCHLWPAPLYDIFPHYLRNGTIFWEKILLNIKCVFWFSLHFSSETFVTLEIIQRYAITSVHVKHTLLLSYYNETLIFSIDLRETLKYQISWKSVRWKPSCFMRTDGRNRDGGTDMTKLIFAVRNFANAFRNCYIILALIASRFILIIWSK